VLAALGYSRWIREDGKYYAGPTGVPHPFGEEAGSQVKFTIISKIRPCVYIEATLPRSPLTKRDF